jgi:hypothetical protein
MKPAYLFVVVILIGIASCQNEVDKKTVSKVNLSKDVFSDSSRIIGKRLRLIYPECTTFESFRTDSTIVWTSVNLDGDREEGHENVIYSLIEGNIHFVGWVTKDGQVVSQILDTKGMKVYTIINRTEGKSGVVKRNGEMYVGSIQLLQ